MKKINYFFSLAILLAFFSISCEDSIYELEPIETNSESQIADSNRKKMKIEICHYDESTNSYVRLSISENGLNGHQKHAKDIINFDADGDGYPVENECGINFREDGLWDCDDTDANLNPGTNWYLDSDGDGYAVSSLTSCLSPGLGYTLAVLPISDLNDNDPNITDVEPVSNCFYANGEGVYTGQSSSIYGDALSNLVVSLDNNGNYILTGTITIRTQVGRGSYEDTVNTIHAVFGENWNDGPGGSLYTQFSMMTLNDIPVLNMGTVLFNCNNIEEEGYTLDLYISIPGQFYGGAIRAYKYI